MSLRRVVVTGLGALTPIGSSINEYWDGLSKGVSGAATITRFDAGKFRTQFAFGVHALKESADVSITENCEGTHDYIANIPQTQRICIMWRSFFMAVGIFLILLGTPALLWTSFVRTGNMDLIADHLEEVADPNDFIVVS